MPEISVRDILKKYSSDPYFKDVQKQKTEEEDVQKILESESDQMFFAPDIPPEIAANAVKAIAKHINPADILLLLDTSIFSNGKAGLILTENALYWKDAFDRFMIKFSDLHHADVVDKELIINKKLSHEFSSVESKNRATLLNILKDVIKAKKDLKAAPQEKAPFSQTAAAGADSVLKPYHAYIFYAFCLVPWILLGAPILIVAPLAYLYHRYMDKIAVFQLQAQPINLDAKLSLDKTRIYNVLNEAAAELNVGERILIQVYKSSEINSFMLPAKKGHHLFLTSKAIKQCSKTELKSMFLYALSLSVNNDYKEMLKMLSVFLIPSLILGLFLKAIYLPLVFEFRFISIKSLRRLLLKGYKWLISDTRLTERFSLAFTLTYVCFPAAAVLLTSCSRKLVAKADAAACERAGLIDYVYSIYNARYGIAKVSAMEIEFTPLKFKRIFYGLFITPGLSRRLKLLKYV